MSLHPGDIVLAQGFPCAALCLSSQELAWNDVSGVIAGSMEEFAKGRSIEVLRLPDPLQRMQTGAFPPSLDPRHSSIPERELVAFLTAGHPVDLEEALPFVLKTARAQIGHDFLSEDATPALRETASVVFVLNSWLVAESCHGVTIHADLSVDDLRRGHFVSVEA